MNLKGGLFIALGMLILAIGDNYIRFLTEKVGLWQFHLIRSLIAIPLLILFSIYQNWLIIFPKNFKRVFYRTTLMVIAMLIYFGCLAFFPISQVAAGLFTSPFFVIIFSNIFYKEKFNFIKILSILIGSIGVFMVLNIKINDFTYGTMLPIFAGAFYALSSITTRKWCKDEDSRSLMFMFFTGIGLSSFIVIIALELNSYFLLVSITKSFISIGFTWIDSGSLLIILFHALISVVGGIFITYGYQKGETSFVAIFEYSFLFFATSWGVLFLSDYISAYIISGMVLIVLSGTLVSVTENSKKSVSKSLF